MPRTALEIQVYDEIGPWGVSSKVFADALKGEGDRVEVLINSPGGDIMEGLGICSMLRAEKRPVRCTIMGAAASMASVIAAAAPECVMWDSAFLMLHNPQGVGDVLVFGEADDMREGAAQLAKQADVLDFLKARLVGLYQRGGKVTADIAAMMNAETWISADDAFKFGLVDKVIPAPKAQPQAMWRAGGWRNAAPPSRPRAAFVPTPPNKGVTMADPKRVQAILVAVSGALSLAQEGVESDDPAEKAACAELAKGLAPCASAFQALLPAGAVAPMAFAEALACAEAVQRLTQVKSGLAGAVDALARNARAAERITEAEQVKGIVAEMVRDGQIGPPERTHYEGMSLANARASQMLLRKPEKPPAQASVNSAPITADVRPGKGDAPGLAQSILAMTGNAPAGGAQ